MAHGRPVVDSRRLSSEGPRGPQVEFEGFRSVRGVQFVPGARVFWAGWTARYGVDVATVLPLERMPRRTSSRTACSPNERDFHDPLDTWYARVNARQHRAIRGASGRPPHRRPGGHARAVRDATGNHRRCVVRVPPDPYVRIDCDYSLNPDLVGPQTGGPLTDRGVLAVALDTADLACATPAGSPDIARSPHTRARQGAQALTRPRCRRRRAGVETRALHIYDALIA